MSLDRKLVAALAILLIIVVLMLLVPLKPLTLVSITRVELQGGSEQDKKWVQGYWVISFTLDQYEEYMGYLEVPLGKNTTATTLDGKTVYTNANVKIKLRPEKAYLTRPIRLVSEVVTPTTYEVVLPKVLGAVYADKNVKTDSYSAQYYVWAGDPEIHTVWTAEVYVEDNLVGSARIDTKQGDTTVTIDTNKGKVIVKNLGYLQGRYIPTWQDIIAFSRRYVYRYGDAHQYIPYDLGAQKEYVTDRFYKVKSTNAYSVYWAGDMRWAGVSGDEHAKDTPYILAYADPTPYGGWIADDDFWNFKRKFVAPVTFPEDEDTYHRPYMSLIEYIEYKGTQNIAETLFPNAESWTLDTQNMQVIVNIPWNAYYIPMGVAYVPSELADTWVYYPPKSNVKITAVGWDTGESVRQISGTARCWVDIVQQADVESSAKITAQPSTPKALISPAETTVTLKPGETRRLFFDVQNLGVDADTDGYVTFVAYETWTNTETSRNSNLQFKLLKYSEEKTILDVLVIDKEKQSPVGGITVFVYYEGQTKSGITSTSGTCTFDLGTFRGVVTLTTTATDLYKSATITKMVSGRTSITIELEKQTPPPTPPIPDWLIYIVIVVIIAVMIIVVAYVVSRRKP